MCDLTLSVFCQKQITLNSVPWNLVTLDKTSPRASGVLSFTAWFSLLKCVSNDHKIKDIEAENLDLYNLI